MAKKIKKVCFVVPRAYYLFNPLAKKPVSDKVGGAQKQSYLLSTALSAMNRFDVHFIVADFDQEENEVIKDVTLWKSFNFSSNFIVKSVRFIKSLIKVKADIYVFRSADKTVAMAVFFINYLLRAKVVYMLASNSETSYYSNKMVFGKLTAKMMQFVYKKANCLVAQTNEQAELFTQNQKRKPDAIIKNVIDENEQNNYQNRAVEFILWVGRLDKVKNPELFLRLATENRAERFVMIAPLVLEHKDYGMQMKKKIKDIPNVEYYEFVSPDKMPGFYEKAKIYVITSETEGFSNTMMEAMASGCPVYSYKVNPENIISKYQLGYCANGSVPLFFEKFNSLIKEHDKLMEDGNRAYQYIILNHSKEKETLKLTELLEQL